MTTWSSGGATGIDRPRNEAKRAAWRERWERALSDVSPREMRAAAKVMRRLGEAFEQEPPEGG